MWPEWAEMGGWYEIEIVGTFGDRTGSAVAF